MKNYEQFVNESKIYDSVKSSLKNLWKNLFKSDSEGLESENRQKLTDVLGKNDNEPKQVYLSDILRPKPPIQKEENNEEESYEDFKKRKIADYKKRQEEEQEEKGVENLEEYKKRQMNDYIENKRRIAKERENAERELDNKRWELPKKSELPKEIETEQEIKAKKEIEKEKGSFSRNQEEIKAQLLEIAGNIYTDFLKSKNFKHFSFKREDNSNQLYYYFTNGNKIYFEFIKGANTSILIYTKNNHIITYKLNSEFTDNFVTAFMAMTKIRRDILNPKGAKEIDINRNKNIESNNDEEENIAQYIEMRKLLKKAKNFYCEYIDDKYKVGRTRTKEEQEEIKNNFSEVNKAIEYLMEIEEDSSFYPDAQILINKITDLFTDIEQKDNEDNDDRNNDNTDNRFYR